MRQRFITLAILITLAAMLWDGKLRMLSATAGEVHLASALPNHLQLAISVVWEGSHMQDHNIRALQNFRKDFTDVSLIHFVSPSYFLGNDASTNMEKLRSVLQRQDRVGLLASGWRSVVEAAGVALRTEPTFWGQRLPANQCVTDCADDVPLSAYTAEEQQKILAEGKAILQARGLGSPQAVMVSGWLGSDTLSTAMSGAGFRYDFSAVPPELLETRLRFFPLFSWIRQSWYDVTPLTQPSVVSVKPEAITRIPQSLAAVDYVSVAQVGEIFTKYRQALHADHHSDMVLQLVLHQETAESMLPRLASSLRVIFNEATKDGINLKHLSLPETGVRDKYDLEPLRYAPPKRFVH